MIEKYGESWDLVSMKGLDTWIDKGGARWGPQAEPLFCSYAAWLLWVISAYIWH